MDRRLIKTRISTLKRHLETVRGRRAQNRASRVRNNVPTASIVGYTNAGKSTLFNAMTGDATFARSEEHTSELQSLMRISYAVFCLKKTKITKKTLTATRHRS